MSNKILPNTNPTLAEATAMANALASGTAIVAPNGANGAPVVPLPEKANVTALKSAIESALDVYNDVHDHTVTAKGEFEEIGKQELGSRETLLVTLAKVSSELECTRDDIDAAVKPAVESWCKRYNTQHNTQRTPETMSTFIGECKRAMHPAARDLVVETIAASNDAWDAEVLEADAYAQRKAQAKRDGVEFTETAPDRPLQRCFAKRYHMVVGSKGVLATHVNAAEATAKKQTPKIAVEFADDFHALAAAHATQERTDPKRVARMLDKLVETLQGVVAEFPHELVSDMLEYAQDLVKDKKAVERLQKARDDMLATQAAAAKRANSPIRTKRSVTPAPVTPAATGSDTGDAIADAIGALV